MKTLSNAELQDAIEHTVRLIRGDGSRSSVILTVHLEALTDEQRRRAADELTLEPMTTTLERAEFDARVRAQPCSKYCGDLDYVCACYSIVTPGSAQGGPSPLPIPDQGPRWIQWGGGVAPVPGGNKVEVIYRGSDEPTEKGEADGFYWYHDGDEADILFYRDWTRWEQSK